jgi:hypothetical protein
MSHRVLFVLCAALPVLGCKSGSGFGPPPPSDLPEMTSVNASVREDNVSVTFDPVDGAQDYRIYEIPASGDAGTTNVVYRCAGNREAFPVALDGETDPSGSAVHTRVNSAVLGFNRTTADATLGYVWTTAGDGRVPVYSLGDPSASGDNACFFARYDESRVKKLTTDANERATLISQGWRDMGIPFYAAAAGTAGATQIDMAQTGATNTDRLYFTDLSAEKATRGSYTIAPAFSVLAAQAPGTVPLMRVFYQNGCGHSHDELMAGQARFAKAEHQGPQPATTLMWSGIKGPTTLAIEALSSGCPYQGLMSAAAVPAGTYTGIAHQAFMTPDQMQAADPNHNLYINGQHDGVGAPTPIARSFVQVAPRAAESWDFREGFDTDPIKDLVAQPNTNLFMTTQYLSSKYSMSAINMESNSLFSAGVLNGELSLTYADWASDSVAKFRLTPLQKSNLSAGSYLHATMEVDAFSTARRYPQIIISSADAPIQTVNVAPNLDNMTNASTLIMQAFDSWPTRADIQACINRSWDVNNQCPRYQSDWATDYSTQNQPPVPAIGELESGDKRVRFDVWASTSKVYFMLDGKPVACANLTAAHTMPAGAVTVTFGDVLYHSGVDLAYGSNPATPYPGFPFHEKHLLLETHRHFDELAFKSGQPAPQWDETLVPCATSHDCGTCATGTCSTCVQ